MKKLQAYSNVSLNVRYVYCEIINTGEAFILGIA